MAFGNAVTFAETEKYVTDRQSCSYKTARLYGKTSSDGKTYFEGAVQLSNGQYIWISFGTEAKVLTDSKNRPYRNVNVKITAPKGSKKQSRGW